MYTQNASVYLGLVYITHSVRLGNAEPVSSCSYVKEAHPHAARGEKNYWLCLPCSRSTSTRFTKLKTGTDELIRGLCAVDWWDL